MYIEINGLKLPCRLTPAQIIVDLADLPGWEGVSEITYRRIEKLDTRMIGAYGPLPEKLPKNLRHATLSGSPAVADRLSDWFGAINLQAWREAVSTLMAAAASNRRSHIRACESSVLAFAVSYTEGSCKLNDMLTKVWNLKNAYRTTFDELRYTQKRHTARKLLTEARALNYTQSARGELDFLLSVVSESHQTVAPQT